MFVGRRYNIVAKLVKNYIKNEEKNKNDVNGLANKLVQLFQIYHFIYGQS